MATGIASALLFLPVFNAGTWVPELRRSLLSKPVAKIVLSALAGTVWLAVISGSGWAFYPVALLAVGGLVLSRRC